VDVPAVGMIVIASGGKAEVATRQRIGRGLRAKKNAANICFVVDFNDKFNKHTKKHYKTRLKIIEETPGFAEGIVPDFDYSLLK
jgi:superfamily II DNA or RNA helicase